MSEFQLQNGMKLYYESHGTGSKTLVMLHGWTSNHTIFHEPVTFLRKKARCIIYDHRGHGNSKNANGEHVSLETLASDLHELITGLNLSDVTLFGWSMGAATALTYVRDYGCDALSQLVLCDMTPKQLNDESWKLGLYKGAYTADDAARSAQLSLLEIFKDFAVKADPRIAKIPNIALNPILGKYLEEYDAGVLNDLSEAMKTADLRDTADKITVPLTYFYAEPGSLFSPALARWYRTHVHVPYHSVGFTKSSHMLIQEHPELFAKELARLL